MTEVLQVTIEPEGEREFVIQDAQNADDWPDGDLHEVVLDPTQITIEGTPEAIRWLYDWMEESEDAFRLEGAQWMADDCRDIADILWNELPEDPPERQRPRRILR